MIAVRVQHIDVYYIIGLMMCRAKLTLCMKLVIDLELGLGNIVPLVCHDRNEKKTHNIG